MLAVRIAAALVVGVLLLCVGLTLPLRWIDPPTSSFMIRYARATPPSVVARFDWQPMDRIAPSLAVAVIAAEDQRFLDHRGFDFASIASALEENQSRARPRGASTITQQLAKNLYLWPGRSMIRKGLEAGMTLFLELCLPKRRILEIYLNVVQFGPGVYGAGAAATAFFDKSAAELTEHDSALLAAVLPSPSRSSVVDPSAYVQARAAFIERQSRQLGGDSLVADL
jgi:monofunctional biosynthetic peptidoglycan transglycosylase